MMPISAFAGEDFDELGFVAFDFGISPRFFGAGRSKPRPYKVYDDLAAGLKRLSGEFRKNVPRRIVKRRTLGFHN
jgi:hypothetical protein